MTDKPTYPECLRRSGASGLVQSRTAVTEQRYRDRYSSMARTWCREHGRDVVTPFELASRLAGHAAAYARNTLKQYHAAIRQHLRDLWDDGAIRLDEVERIDALLRGPMPAPGRRKEGEGTGKTSGGRAKSIRPQTLSALVAALLRSPTPVRRIAAALLEHGVVLATRPSEFLAIEETDDTVFCVPSAKFSDTNGRGLQPDRILPTDNYERFEIEDLRAVIRLVAEELAAAATLESILRRCQRAIREARRTLGQKKTRIAAYTVRHQARANMAAMGMSPEEVAVVMGHASADTAQSHYAPARRAWRGMSDLTPPVVDPTLVALVRPARPSRGWDRSRAMEHDAPRL